MSILKRNYEELLDLALNTTSFSEMLFLVDHNSMNIRRALSSNNNIHESILNMLIRDPVQNVSYVASQNPKNNEKREFYEQLRPCVLCDEKEHILKCEDCKKISDHSLLN